MTYDASHKVGRGSGHALTFFRHIARDADIAAGFSFGYSNRNIVLERTHLNFTRVNDGVGGFRALGSVDGRPPSQEFDDYLSIRLATVKRPLRKDAVLIRGLILQLDPVWFVDNNPEWQTEGMNPEAISHMNAAMSWACKEFGQQNVVGFSLHLDEYSPQLQVLMTPVTEDGRLSQKDFFRGPRDLMRQHKELRAHMDAAGYDVELRVTERSKEHLSSSEFQAKANRLREVVADVEDEKAAYETFRRSLTNREANLDVRESGLAAREQKLAAERVQTARALEAAQEAERDARSARAAALRSREEAERERDRLRATADQLQRIPPDIDRWLDKAKFGGKPAREYFDAAAAKAGAARLEVAQMMDGGAIGPFPGANRRASGPLSPNPDGGAETSG